MKTCVENETSMYLNRDKTKKEKREKISVEWKKINKGAHLRDANAFPDLLLLPSTDFLVIPFSIQGLIITALNTCSIMHTLLIITLNIYI